MTQWLVEEAVGYAGRMHEAAAAAQAAEAEATADRLMSLALKQVARH